MKLVWYRNVKGILGSYAIIPITNYNTRLERCKGNAKLYLGREVQQDWKFIDVTVDYIF